MERIRTSQDHHQQDQYPSYDEDGLRAFYGADFNNYVEETIKSKGNKQIEKCFLSKPKRFIK